MCNHALHINGQQTCQQRFHVSGYLSRNQPDFRSLKLGIHGIQCEYNACQKMYFDRDVVRSLVDMGMKEARAKWASHFLHDDSFATDRHALFFTHVHGMADYIFNKRTGYF